ncbi:type II secretion system protein GspM [Thioalkalivibrio sp. ALE11]|uniref:type II secretion system protein GspM n=1 Tax=Thioalkalivibrio sp. ALE11 TaxID=1265494 RepID=UPI0003820C24|nr:type II secretion system protein GspM [Thioalkalivibrio sp. ALE11]
MREYWNNLRTREQRILLLGGAIAAAALVFLLLVEPTREARQQAEQRLAETRGQLHWMQAHADTVAERAAAGESESGGGPGGGHSGGSLLAHVDAAARAAGLREPLQRVRPSGDGVNVILEDAAFGELMTWLDDLETEDGVVPVRLSLERGSRSGHVHADLQLEPAGFDDD